MKNKKLVYLLLPINLILWGYIGQTFLKSFESDSELNNKISETFEPAIISEIEDTATLLLNYRDPFVGNLNESKKLKMKFDKGNSNQLPVQSNSKNNGLKSKWPDIKYHGMMRNSNSKITLAVVNVNDVEHLIKIGHVADSIKLLKVYKDSILVQFQREKKLIIKQ